MVAPIYACPALGVQVKVGVELVSFDDDVYILAVICYPASVQAEAPVFVVCTAVVEFAVSVCVAGGPPPT